MPYFVNEKRSSVAQTAHIIEQTVEKLLYSVSLSTIY